MRESRKKNSNSESGSPGVEFGQLEKLLDFMTSHGLEEFEYEHAGLRIRLRKAAPSPNSAPPTGAAPQAMQAQAAVLEPHSGTAATPSPAAVTEDLHTIKSPIVGTFYASASPGAPPFVKIGDV